MAPTAEPTDNQPKGPERFRDTVGKDEGPVFPAGGQHAVQGLPVRTVQRMEEGMWKAKGRYGFTAVMYGIYRTMKVCRNARCAFFLIHHYINRFIFFKLR